jgi:putative transposase
MFALFTPSAREAAVRRENDLLRAQLHGALRICREHLGHRPLPFTDDERRHIAERAQACGWSALTGCLLVVSVASLRRWFRRFVSRAPRRTQPRRRPGRPPIAARIRRLVVRIARRNPTWGYDRIAGCLANLGIHLSDRSVGNILREHHVPTAPERQRRSRQWKAFLAAHWRGFAAIDGFSVPVVTLAGFRFTTVLVVIHLATRRIHIAGVTQHPDSVVMTNIARGLALDEVGFLSRHAVTHLIHDGDGAFTKTGFIGILADRRVTCVRIPPGAPNCNAFAERVIQTIQRECTDHIVFLGDRALRAAVLAYADHYHRRRNHQGIGNLLIDPGPEVGRRDGEIRESITLGGLLRYYHRGPLRAAA